MKSFPEAESIFFCKRTETINERQLRITCPESGAFFVQTITEVNMDYENFKEELKTDSFGGT